MPLANINAKGGDAYSGADPTSGGVNFTFSPNSGIGGGKYGWLVWVALGLAVAAFFYYRNRK